MPKLCLAQGATVNGPVTIGSGGGLLSQSTPTIRVDPTNLVINASNTGGNTQPNGQVSPGAGLYLNWDTGNNPIYFQANGPWLGSGNTLHTKAISMGDLGQPYPIYLAGTYTAPNKDSCLSALYNNLAEPCHYVSPSGTDNSIYINYYGGMVFQNTNTGSTSYFDQAGNLHIGGQIYTTGGFNGQSYANQVLTVAALRASSTQSYPGGTWLAANATPGDNFPRFYVPQRGACGTDDSYYCINSSDGQQWNIVSPARYYGLSLNDYLGGKDLPLWLSVINDCSNAFFNNIDQPCGDTSPAGNNDTIYLRYPEGLVLQPSQNGAGATWYDNTGNQHFGNPTLLETGYSTGLLGGGLYPTIRTDGNDLILNGSNGNGVYLNWDTGTAAGDIFFRQNGPWIDTTNRFYSHYEVITDLTGGLPGNFRMVDNGSLPAAIWRNDGTNTYLLFTNPGGNAYTDTFNNLRPITIGDTTGNVAIGAGGPGNLYVDNNTYLSNMSIGGPGGQALFVFDGSSLGAIAYPTIRTDSVNLVLNSGNGGNLYLQNDTGADIFFRPNGPWIDTTNKFYSHYEVVTDLTGGDPANFRMVPLTGSGIGSMWRNDGSYTYFLLTPSGNAYGTFNNLRPLDINDTTGDVLIGDGGPGNLYSYKNSYFTSASLGDLGTYGVLYLANTGNCAFALYIDIDEPCGFAPPPGTIVNGVWLDYYGGLTFKNDYNGNESYFDESGNFHYAGFAGAAGGFSGGSFDVVRDCGADRTGSSDSWNAIQTCINDVQALPQGGGRVWIPSGVYKLSNCLTVSNPGVVIRGEGQYSTILQQNSNCGNFISLNSDHDEVTDLTFLPSTNLSDTYQISMNNGSCYMCAVRRVSILYATSGIASYGATGTVIENISMRDLLGSTGHLVWGPSASEQVYGALEYFVVDDNPYPLPPGQVVTWEPNVGYGQGEVTVANGYIWQVSQNCSGGSNAPDPGGISPAPTYPSMYFTGTATSGSCQWYLVANENLAWLSWGGYAYTVNTDHSNYIDGGYGMLVNNCAGSQFSDNNDLETDHNFLGGVYLGCGYNVQIVNSWMGSVINPGGNGVTVGSGFGGDLKIVASRIYGNAYCGVLINANNAIVQENTIAANGVGNICVGSGVGNVLDNYNGTY